MMLEKLKTQHIVEAPLSNITIYHEQEQSAAQAVIDLLITENPKIASQLTLTAPPQIHLFIYDHLQTLHEKYEVLVNRKPAEWVVGTCENNIILTVSPANPGDDHDFTSIMQVAIHEMVHVYNQQLNPAMPLWIDESLATYLSNMNPRSYNYQIEYIPTYEEMQLNDSEAFANAGGYELSYFYIEFLCNTYGWDAVIKLVRTSDYMQAFSLSPQDVYEKWKTILLEEFKCN